MKAGKVMISIMLTILMLLIPSVAAHAREYAAAKAPGLGITETPHDLKHQLGFENIDLCSWCHAPHGDFEQIIPPLWSQESPERFAVYSQGPDEQKDRIDEETAEALQYRPGPSSMLCLSCHDGSNASNKYGFISKIIGRASMESFSYSGNAPAARLKEHPIGFDYRKAERSMFDLRRSSETVSESFAIEDLLRQGRVECVTCHDVHNIRNQGEKFLWTSDARSNFCFTCHLK